MSLMVPAFMMISVTAVQENWSNFFGMDRQLELKVQDQSTGLRENYQDYFTYSRQIYLQPQKQPLYIPNNQLSQQIKLSFVNKVHYTNKECMYFLDLASCISSLGPDIMGSSYWGDKGHQIRKLDKIKQAHFNGFSLRMFNSKFSSTHPLTLHLQMIQ